MRTLEEIKKYLMPDKLTDSEIAKALECHRHIGKETCDSCPLQGVSMCSFVLINEVYNRFNRLQAENRAKDYFEKLVPKQKEIIDKQEAEIERYKKYYFAHEYDKWEKEIKSEAYKECIEKAKSEIDSQAHSRSLEASGERFRIHKILDNLLKELAGEDDA